MDNLQGFNTLKTKTLRRLDHHITQDIHHMKCFRKKNLYFSTRKKNKQTKRQE